MLKVKRTDKRTYVGLNEGAASAITFKEKYPQIPRIPLLIGIVLSSILLGCGNSKQPDVAIDHIILAIHNLDSGINQIRSLTGIEPVYGGEHPDSYTHNALFSVGADTYVEILAPRNDLDSVPDYFKQFDKLTPIGWAISSTNIESTKGTLENESFKMGEIIPGSRVAANGKTLEWKTCVLLNSDDESAPFFINWDVNTTHPSKSSPSGCTLKRMKIGAEDQVGLSRVFESLGLSDSRLTLDESGSGGLELILDTPRGEVTFSNKQNAPGSTTKIKYSCWAQSRLLDW